MTSTALTRPTGAIFWELRGAWALGRRIALTLDGLGRIEGMVSKVAATDAFVRVNGRHVPGDRILAVHRPSMLGDSEFDPRRSPRAFDGKGRRPAAPQREELPLG